MNMQRAFQGLAAVTLLATVLSACGQGAIPTATAVTPSASPVPVATKSASPTPAASPSSPGSTSATLPVGLGYSAEKAKELIAQKMYMSGMSYGAGETPQYGGTASYSNKAPLPNDDISTTTSITMINVLGSLVSDGNLVKLEESNNNEFMGNVAQSWTVSSDYKTWTFKLRPNVKWHDGVALSAEDVKFWLDLAFSPPKGRVVGSIVNALPGYKSTEVIDPLTVRLTFKEPSPYLLETFAPVTGTMVHPKHLAQPQIDKGNVNVSQNDIGWVSIGPFKFDHYERGSSFRTVRFDQYWEKDDAGRALPYLDVVYNVFIPDRTVALGAFRAGRLDSTPRGVGSSMDPDMVASITKTLGAKGAWYHRYPYNNYGIAFNSTKAPFNDIRARKAVFLYMDRAEGAQKMQGGYAFGSGFLNPAASWHSDQYKVWPGFNPATKAQDQAEAKRLMKEAGLVGTPVSIACRTDFLYMCEFAESVLRGVGFESRIEIMDLNQVRQTTEGMRHQTYILGICNGFFPSQCLEAWVSTAQRSGNVTNDLKFDEYQKTILTSLDVKERKEALWASERRMLLEQAYDAPFLREETVQAYRTYLKGSVVPGYQPHQNTNRATDWIDKSMR